MIATLMTQADKVLDFQGIGSQSKKTVYFWFEPTNTNREYWLSNPATTQFGVERSNNHFSTESKTRLYAFQAGNNNTQH